MQLDEVQYLDNSLFEWQLPIIYLIPFTEENIILFILFKSKLTKRSKFILSLLHVLSVSFCLARM